MSSQNAKSPAGRAGLSWANRLSAEGHHVLRAWRLLTGPSLAPWGGGRPGRRLHRSVQGQQGLDDAADPGTALVAGVGDIFAELDLGLPMACEQSARGA